MIGAISGVGAYSPAYMLGAAANSAVHAPQSVSKNAPVWATRRSSNPEAAVEPVTPVRPAPSADGGHGRLFRQELPVLREGVDPVEWAVRMRIQPAQAGGEAANPAQGNMTAPAVAGAASGLPGGGEKAVQLPGLPGEGAALPSVETDAALGADAVQEAAEEGRCQTCEERKYQDGSDDPGVSFKTPTNVSPEQAASAVRGHEQEHVVREQAKAQREDRRVVSQSVTYHTDICPECGKVYVSGGTTRTVTAANAQPEQQPDPRKEKGAPYAPFSAVA